jgi:phosphatidylglycerol:prolipoprotein diacylglycerol transferase
MIILSIIPNVIVVILLSKKFKYTKEEIVSMLLVDTVGIVMIGLIYTKILYGYFGFSSLGGMLGGLLFLYIYSLMFKKDYKYILILFMPSIPLMYAIGKIGCFVAGCCYGIPYDGIFHVVYESGNFVLSGMKLFPIQIVETIVFLLIFICVISKYVKDKMNIKMVMIEIIICGLAKLLLDFLRYDYVSKLFTSNQIMCLILVIASVIYLFRLKKNAK